MKRMYLAAIEYDFKDKKYYTYLVSYKDITKRVQIVQASCDSSFNSYQAALDQLYNVASGIRITGNECCIGYMNCEKDDTSIQVNLDDIKAMTGIELLQHLTRIGFDTDGF